MTLSTPNSDPSQPVASDGAGTDTPPLIRPVIPAPVNRVAGAEPPRAARAALAILLSITLGLFLADAGVSLLDDTLTLGLGVHALSVIRGMLFGLLFLASLLVYLLMGMTPMIPKRFFLPIVLFIPAAHLAVIPLFIFHLDHVQPITWGFSLGQLLLGLGILWRIQGALRFRWPAVREEQLGCRPFSWMNLTSFVLVNGLVIPPAVMLYLAICASLAVDHFSGGFLTLSATGLAIRAKTYVRDDHKTVQLIPMMHIGEAAFYDRITKSMPTNAFVLLEGVTDRKNLLKQELSYRRAAESLGLVEQKENLAPPQGRSRLADVDVEEFSERTIAFLNIVSVIHARGWQPEPFLHLMQVSQEPLFLERLMDDLLTRRNTHLLKEIEAALPEAEMIVVPWGAAHMRGIAEGIEKAGFRETDSREHQIFHFRSMWRGLRQTKRKLPAVKQAG
jgi:hypothetical protein